jgi:hypothetical protein
MARAACNNINGPHETSSEECVCVCVRIASQLPRRPKAAGARATNTDIAPEHAQGEGTTEAAARAASRREEQGQQRRGSTLRGAVPGK